MGRVLGAFLGLIVGYLVFAIAGYGLIGALSSNGFDRSVEASMTAIFAIGPAGALIGLVTGIIVAGRRPR